MFSNSCFFDLFPNYDRKRHRVIMVFSEIEGSEVLFFMMYVTERMYENSKENKTEIEYIDSVKYFEPAPLRTGLYFEVVICYLNYARDAR